MTRIMWRLRRYRREDTPRVVAWIAANGLDAHHIPISSPIVTTATTLTIKLYLIDTKPEPGDVVLHQGAHYAIARRTVALVEEPPEDLFEPTQLADDIVVDWSA